MLFLDSLQPEKLLVFPFMELIGTQLNKSLTISTSLHTHTHVLFGIKRIIFDVVFKFFWVVSFRLGANSLLDIVVFGRACANRIAQISKPNAPHKPLKSDAGHFAIQRLDK
jgi:hypothetical protein